MSPFLAFLILFYCAGCNKLNELTVPSDINSSPGSALTHISSGSTARPNIILILGDDVGYEVPTYTGGQSYSTPNLNFMAANGTQFSQCHAAPLCSPSRFMLMTGKYNFRNYYQWGVMGLNQRTLANLAKRAGYRTCVAGKWQFDGGDQSIHTFGFDKYCINEAFDNEDAEESVNDFYKDPTVYQNGEYLPPSQTHGKYGPNIFRDYVFSFIDSNINRPFFIYWAMNLCHKPFCPTPDDPAYATWIAGQKPSPADTMYFPSMVKYMDKQIGQLITKLQQMQLDKNTMIIFAGDNGTPHDILSKWNGQIIQGGKSKPMERGHHVPLVAYLPGRVKSAVKDTSLIDFTDFMPTFANLFNIPIPLSYGTTDGVSFYPELLGNQSNANLRDWVFCHFLKDPKEQVGVPPKRWMQNNTYKEYDTIPGFFKSNKFYNIVLDPEENTPISPANRTPQEKTIYNSFRQDMSNLH